MHVSIWFCFNFDYTAFNDGFSAFAEQTRAIVYENCGSSTGIPE